MGDNSGLLFFMGLFSLGGTFLWAVLLAIQIGCIVHVIRTGRPYWWMLIIFWFPLLGALAYLFFEIRPSVGKFDYQALMWRLKSPQQRIAIREGVLDDSNTVRNRLALADELHAAGQFDRECAVLSEGLRGAFKDDATLLMRLAQAHLEAGRSNEAEQVLAKTVPEKSPDAQLQFALLKARVAARQGRAAEAEQIFQDLVARKKSEGPRYYYAEYLMHSGQRDQASVILRDILHQYRRGTPVWRFVERRWFYAAKRLLKTPPTADGSAETKG
jgi:hypothetical protein